MFIALVLVCCSTTFRAVRRHSSDVGPVQISVSHGSAQGILGRGDTTTDNTIHNDTNHWTNDTTHNDTDRWLRPIVGVHCEGCGIRASADVDLRSESPHNYVQDTAEKAAVRVSFNPSALYESRSRTHFQNRQAVLDLSIMMGPVAIGICAFFFVCHIWRSVIRNFDEAIDSNALRVPFEVPSNGETRRSWQKSPNPSSTPRTPSYANAPLSTGSSSDERVSGDEHESLDAFGQEDHPELGRQKTPRTPSCTYGPLYTGSSYTSCSGGERVASEDDESLDAFGKEDHPELGRQKTPSAFSTPRTPRHTYGPLSTGCSGSESVSGDDDEPLDAFGQEDYPEWGRHNARERREAHDVKAPVSRQKK